MDYVDIIFAHRADPTGMKKTNLLDLTVKTNPKPSVSPNGGSRPCLQLGKLGRSEEKRV
jgi:hypothetical protein